MTAKTEESKRKMYESQKRIHAATLDKIIVYVKKGTREKYKEYAKSKGVSLNSLIVSLIEKEISK